MVQLPENWNTMSHQQQEIWLITYYGTFPSAGEWEGIYDFAPEEVKQAYEAWKQADSKQS